MPDLSVWLVVLTDWIVSGQRREELIGFFRAGSARHLHSAQCFRVINRNTLLSIQLAASYEVERYKADPQQAGVKLDQVNEAYAHRNFFRASSSRLWEGSTRSCLADRADGQPRKSEEKEITIMATPSGRIGDTPIPP